MKLSVISLLLFVFFQFVTSCAPVPITGRTQLSLVSSAEMIQISSQQYDEIKSTSKLSSDVQQVELVRSVGYNIQKAVEQFMSDNGIADQLEGYDWEYNLIEDDQMVNAWCMPGGKIAFYTGIMPLCRDEAGVAVVMGHEIAHAIANHGRERVSQQLAVQFGLGSIQYAMGQDPSVTQQVVLQGIGVSSSLGVLAFSRKHESEADRIGLIFMAMAGYDPNEAPKFWERMAANSAGQPPEWLSTHPSHETRIADLNAAIPEAMTYYKQ